MLSACAAGKYLNIIRECKALAPPQLQLQQGDGRAQHRPDGLPQPASGPASWHYDPAQPGALTQQIRAAHAAASSELMGMLLGRRGGVGGGGGSEGGAGAGGGGAGLAGVLRSLKHYLLMDQVGTEKGRGCDRQRPPRAGGVLAFLAACMGPSVVSVWLPARIRLCAWAFPFEACKQARCAAPHPVRAPYPCLPRMHAPVPPPLPCWFMLHG